MRSPSTLSIKYLHTLHAYGAVPRVMGENACAHPDRFPSPHATHRLGAAWEHVRAPAHMNEHVSAPRDALSEAALATHMATTHVNTRPNAWRPSASEPQKPMEPPSLRLFLPDVVVSEYRGISFALSPGSACSDDWCRRGSQHLARSRASCFYM